MAMLLKVGVPWLAGFLCVIVLDFIWLGLIASGFYRSRLGHLIEVVDDRMTVNIPAALATWAVIVVGIQFFVFARASATGPLLLVMAWGALFGAVAYAIYDLTNLAVLKSWPLSVTIADIAWGAILCSITALCVALASRGVARFL